MDDPVFNLLIYVLILDIYIIWRSILIVYNVNHSRLLKLVLYIRMTNLVDHSIYLRIIQC